MLRKIRRLPRLQVKRVITQDALMAVAGRPGIYAIHTNGVTCDTTSGCNC